MKRSTIDQAFYNNLVAAFRDAPGNHSRAAKIVGCDRRTARRGWTEGWIEFGFVPVKETVEDEIRGARERLKDVRSQELAVQEREKEKVGERRDVAATDDAIASRTEEARTVRAARHNAMGLLSLSQRLLAGAHKLAEKMENEIATAEMKPATAVSLFQSIASTARASNETAKIAIAMERSLLGEPEKIIGHHLQMTESEAVAEIRAAARAAERVEARSTTVIDATPEPI